MAVRKIKVIQTKSKYEKGHAKIKRCEIEKK